MLNFTLLNSARRIGNFILEWMRYFIIISFIRMGRLRSLIRRTYSKSCVMPLQRKVDSMIPLLNSGLGKAIIAKEIKSMSRSKKSSEERCPKCKCDMQYNVFGIVWIENQKRFMSSWSFFCPFCSSKSSVKIEGIDEG